jgi:mannose-6-phosphate isomerase-like protein (cupin superfamily)
MKIVVIGGSGLIGIRLVSKLRKHGQPARQIPNTSLQPAAGTGSREQLMASSKPMLALAFLITITLIITGTLMAEETIKPLMSNDLAGVSGKEVLMYTVDFPPGFSSPVHRHNAQVSLYVLEGSVVMQVRGGKEITLRPGQSFYERRVSIDLRHSQVEFTE